MTKRAPRTKREQALWDDGYARGFRDGRAEGEQKGRDDLRAEIRELLGGPAKSEIKLLCSDDYF